MRLSAPNCPMAPPSPLPSFLECCSVLNTPTHAPGSSQLSRNTAQGIPGAFLTLQRTYYAPNKFRHPPKTLHSDGPWLFFSGMSSACPAGCSQMTGLEGEDHHGNVAVDMLCVTGEELRCPRHTNTLSGGSSRVTKLFNQDMRGRNSEPPGAKEGAQS